MTPLVSVAMATYNGEKYLRGQLDSILAQTLRDLELVVCDDCSTDGTVRILEEYAQKDGRIKIFRNEKNLGFKKNFEKLVSLCSGEYIAFSDQDDIWEAWKLAESLAHIDGFDLVCTDAALYDSESGRIIGTMKDSLRIKKVQQNQNLIFTHLLFRNFVQGATVLARRDFVQACLPVPDEFVFHDHWIAVIASLRKGIYYLDKCSIRYRQHVSQITTNKPKKIVQELNAIVGREDLLKACDEREKMISSILKIPDIPNEKIAILKETERYYSCMRDKNLYTLMYFMKNYSAIFFDKTIWKRFVRTTKRVLGLIKYRLFDRKKYF